MRYKLITGGWPQNTETGEFVNPTTNGQYLAWLAGGNTPLPAEAPTGDELRVRIKEIRAAAQERFTKNSGVTTVYGLNYEAAVLGAGDTTTILRNDKTPFQHLHDLGQYAISAQYPTGMTAEQFAAYIIAENRGPTPYTAGGVKMTEIEVEYMRVLYAQPVTEQSVAEYQAFCDARQA